MSAASSPPFRPVRVRADDAEELPAIGHLLLVDAAATAGALCTHRVRLGRGQDGAVPHRHHHSSEMFFVVDGELEVLVDDDLVVAGSGDVLVVPRGTPHAFRARPDLPADVLVVLTPGTERFDYFRAVVRRRTGADGPEVLLGQQERFDTHFVDSDVWANAAGRS